MGLKFMQRRQQQTGHVQSPDVASATPTQQPSQQPSQLSQPSQQSQPTPQNQQTPGLSDAEWTLETGSSSTLEAPAAGRVVREQDARAAASDDSGALVKFRAGRRSFGSYNPRLEKRLSEIREGQRAAREAAVREAREAKERIEREAEHAALVAREAEAEAAERESALEMASVFRAKYEKFVPNAAGGSRPGGGGLPPVVNNPVRLKEGPSAKKARH